MNTENILVVGGRKVSLTHEAVASISKNRFGNPQVIMWIFELLSDVSMGFLRREESEGNASNFA